MRVWAKVISQPLPRKKGWNVISNSQEIRKYLYHKCEGHGLVNHTAVRGKEGKKTERYTPEIVSRILSCMSKNSNQSKSQTNEEDHNDE